MHSCRLDQQNLTQKNLGRGATDPQVPEDYGNMTKRG